MGGENTGRRTVWTAWREDLERSRDHEPWQQRGIVLLVEWYLNGRAGAELLPGRDSAKRFWREAVLAKERKDWQLPQWAEAMAWFLNWRLLVQKEESLPTAPSLPMRVKRAVIETGMRRGLQRSTGRYHAAGCVRSGREGCPQPSGGGNCGCTLVANSDASLIDARTVTQSLAGPS